MYRIKMYIWQKNQLSVASLCIFTSSQHFQYYTPCYRICDHSLETLKPELRASRVLFALPKSITSLRYPIGKLAGWFMSHSSFVFCITRRGWCTIQCISWVEQSKFQQYLLLMKWMILSSTWICVYCNSTVKFFWLLTKNWIIHVTPCHFLL